ncbi:MAG: glycine cleavage system aminomethyltransferase GcvT [Acidimicrobiales bacterium]|nr:glycine cleavage system aminomethyltransferase GcvT [Acidimicrobiales bacterium]
MEPSLRRSPLDAAHRVLGAKMVPFGGWEMPLSYAGGTLTEHMACREDAVVFDVSHLGTVRVEGAGSRDLLQRTFTNDLAKVEPGRAQYTHLLDDTDASVLDDIIVWWTDDESFDVMPNASNTARVRAALEGHGRDVTAERAIIAVQGPNARARLAAVVPEAAAVGRFRVTRFEWNGIVGVAAGTGYTGEDGVECALPGAHAVAFWETLLGTGIRPAGLGARDTLRLEAALPLHGHELGPGITPLQAGLSWVVSWTKPGGFRGREALERERDRGVSRLLAGLATEGRQPPRGGADVLHSGKRVGEVTSGNFSPVLGHGIALAFLPPDLTVGTGVEIDLRGRPVPATVVALPFVKKKG